MPIVDLVTHHVRVPLRAPFVTALRHTTAVDAVLVEVRDEDGRSGWGEAAEVWQVTGASIPGITAALRGPLRAAVVGRDPADLEAVTRDVAHAVVGNTAAKAALDCAVHDLAAQRLRIPLVRLLGGTATRVPTDVTVSIGDTDTMTDSAARRRGEGFTVLKIKVGDPAADELHRLTAIRRAVGDDVALRLDANQGWTPKQAVRLIRSFEDAGLAPELVEQPVPSGDLDALAWVTERVDTPVLADESVWSPGDLLELVRRRAADLVNVKLAKCGGLRSARQLVAMAEASGVDVVVGSMLETHVGVAAAASLAAVTASSWTPDLDAAWWLTRSPVRGGAGYDGPVVALADAPGLGVAGVADDTLVS